VPNPNVGAPPYAVFVGWEGRFSVFNQNPIASATPVTSAPVPPFQPAPFQSLAIRTITKVSCDDYLCDL